MKHQPQREAVRRANQNHGRTLLARDDVIAVAVGLRQEKGEAVPEHVLKVFVERKLPREQLSPERILPQFVVLPGDQRVRVDVEEMQSPTSPPLHSPFGLEFQASDELRQYRRPALGGMSVAHYLFSIGTITVGVRDRRLNGAPSILSCNHVLARMNGASYGDPILQPATTDGGVYPRDMIGRLTRFVTVKFGPDSFNQVDCAVALPSRRNILQRVDFLGPPRGVRSASGVWVGEQVQKVGRTTGLTRGTVVATDAQLKISYEALGFGNGVALFEHQLITTNMCGYGDSGSLLFDDDRNAVGLLFGGSPTHTFFNYVEAVQNQLGVVVSEKIV